MPMQQTCLEMDEHEFFWVYIIHISTIKSKGFDVFDLRVASSLLLVRLEVKTCIKTMRAKISHFLE